MLLPARMIGAATAAYGAAVIAKPSLLTRPTGLSMSDEDVPTAGRVLSRAVGARDLVSGVLMAAAPTAAGVRIAAMVRIGTDITDAVGFGLALPDRAARKKTAAVALGWAVLAGLTMALAGSE